MPSRIIKLVLDAEVRINSDLDAVIDEAKCARETVPDGARIIADR